MFFVLFALWMIFNGRVTLEVVVFGLVLSAALTAFAQRVCGWSAEADRSALRIAPKLLLYVGHMFIEIIKANLAVIRVILTPGRDEIKPRLFFFDTHLQSEEAKAVLANTITITPGTYTVGIYGSTFGVHALNKSFEAGTPDSDFDHRLMEMEAALGASSGKEPK